MNDSDELNETNLDLHIFGENKRFVLIEKVTDETKKRRRELFFERLRMVISEISEETAKKHNQAIDNHAKKSNKITRRTFKR